MRRAGRRTAQLAALLHQVHAFVVGRRNAVPAGVVVMQREIARKLHAAPEGLRTQGLDCPDWLEESVMQLLEKEPYKRPFNARAVQGRFRERLRSALSEEQRA